MRIRRFVTAGVLLAAPLAVPAAASAQQYPVTTTPPEATVLGRDTPRGGAVAGNVAVRGAAQESLVVTGGDIAALTAVGLGAAGVGFVLVRRSRKLA
jgi:hypothetical protein